MFRSLGVQAWMLVRHPLITHLLIQSSLRLSFCTPMLRLISACNTFEVPIKTKGFCKELPSETKSVHPLEQSIDSASFPKHHGDILFAKCNCTCLCNFSSDLYYTFCVCCRFCTVKYFARFPKQMYSTRM